MLCVHHMLVAILQCKKCTCTSRIPTILSPDDYLGNQWVFKDSLVAESTVPPTAVRKRLCLSAAVINGGLHIPQFTVFSQSKLISFLSSAVTQFCLHHRTSLLARTHWLSDETYNSREKNLFNLHERIFSDLMI